VLKVQVFTYHSGWQNPKQPFANSFQLLNFGHSFTRRRRALHRRDDPDVKRLATSTRKKTSARHINWYKSALCGAPKEIVMSFIVNRNAVTGPADPRVSLLDHLRETLHLTGTKKGCNQGACGACTVLVDGERILSCLALAVQYDGRQITTIEGLGEAGTLHPLQTAFIEYDGFQCGYCTPGQICSAIGMAAEARRGVPSNVSANLSDNVTLTREEVQERMSGNLCRCGAHNGIIDAIQATITSERVTEVTA
jgi:xanthine dehydrogenase YagT iron-sulfur-binding subunit